MEWLWFLIHGVIGCKDKYLHISWGKGVYICEKCGREHNTIRYSNGCDIAY